MPVGVESPSTPSHTLDGDLKPSTPIVYKRVAMPYQKDLKPEIMINIYNKWDNYDDVSPNKLFPFIFSSLLHSLFIIDRLSSFSPFLQVLNPRNYRGPSQAAHFVARFVPDTRARILDLAAGTGLVGKEVRYRSCVIAMISNDDMGKRLLADPYPISATDV